MNSYELSRNWFNWSFENPEKINPNHSALFFFIIEHCNRLGWKNKFGLPTTMAKEAIGIKSYKTYIKTLNDLIDFGFIILIEKSKNQYSSNIIAMSNNTKALNKALDKALSKHGSKQDKSTGQSIDSINKQVTSNNEQTNKEQQKEKFNFKNSFLQLGVEKRILDDWLKVRKSKKGTNTETAFNAIKNEIDKSGMSANDCIKISVIKNWVGFQLSWVKPEDRIKLLNEQQDGLSEYVMVIADQFKVPKKVKRDSVEKFAKNWDYTNIKIIRDVWN